MFRGYRTPRKESQARTEWFISMYEAMHEDDICDLWEDREYWTAHRNEKLGDVVFNDGRL